MRSTEIKSVAFNRRAFLCGLGGTSSLLVSGTWHQAIAESLLDPARLDVPLFASTRRDPNGQYSVAIFDETGMDIATVKLPDRGHGLAISPDKRRLVAFARRPGTFALVVEPLGRSEPKLLHSPAGRHFYGHGCFSQDGRLLYAVENDYDNVRGVLGVYDASGSTIQRIGEFETGGIGPHDLVMLDDGHTIVVANGGIETHPNQPRKKLNIATMESSVAYLDIRNGEILAKHKLDKEQHKLSLRHMAKDANGRVWVGGQYQGPTDQQPPLVIGLERDGPVLIADIPLETASGLKNYIGSVVANKSGDVIATSAPRGGQILFWAASDGKFLGSHQVMDGCGLAPIDRESFLISDGMGGIRYLQDTTSYPEVITQASGYSWDNHMSAL